MGAFAGVKELAKAALDLVYPENLYCICCGDLIDASRIHGLCNKCIEKIDWTLDNPYKETMDSFAFDDVMACCTYGFFPRKIIHALKLNGETYIAKNIGRLMAERAMLSEERFDMIIPVPSSPKKLKKRGFNQAQLLAKYVAKELSISLEDKLLIKPHDTVSMRTSRGNERRSAALGAFSIQNPKKLHGKNILLVDDVITTGSTADECARTLKEAECEKVVVLSFACAGHFVL